MERLTARNKHGQAYCPYCFREDTCEGFGEGNCTECDFYLKACERLAELEEKEERENKKTKR